MNSIFVTGIKINKVRQLQDIDIIISNEEKRHLIITGKNGSGKTSLLEEINSYFTVLKKGFVRLGSAQQETEDIGFRGLFPEKKIGVDISFNRHLTFESDEVFKAYSKGEYILAYLPDNRSFSVKVPEKIEKVELPDKFPINAIASKDFVQYLLHLKFQQMAAKEEGDTIEATNLERWFENLENALREIFECETLELKYNRKAYDFSIELPNKEPFAFNELAAGYSSFLSIVMEIMMRMEKKFGHKYDAEGLVLIDEIETHLHLSLQKKIMGFLLKMFPNIQFIVTTHSPFILNTTKNAVVYDLEKIRKVEDQDFSQYSYEGIVEYYFDLNMYSNDARQKFEEYKNLISKKDRTEEEDERLVDAITYLKQIPPLAASEIVYSFRDMEAKRGAKQHGQN